jgi:hypothetical protein
LSPRTKASNFPNTRDKPNKKATNKIKSLSREAPSIAKTIKKYTQPTKKKDILNMEMTKDITKQILKNEQVGRKVFLER